MVAVEYEESNVSVVDYNEALPSKVAMIGGSLSMYSAFLSIFLLWPTMRGLRVAKRLQELRVIEVLIGSAVTDFFGSAGFVLGFWLLVEPNTTFCSFQGYVLQLFELSSIFWSVCVAIVVYQNLELHSNLNLQESPQQNSGKNPIANILLCRRRKPFHIVHFIVFAWLLPIIAAFIPLSEYNYLKFWCWISPSTVLFQFFCFYIWVLLAFIINTAVYIRICQEKKQFKFSLYLIALICVWAMPTISILAHLVSDPSTVVNNDLLDLHALTVTWKGMLDYILTLLIFFLKPRFLEGPCGCCGREENRENEALISAHRLPPPPLANQRARE